MILRRRLWTVVSTGTRHTNKPYLKWIAGTYWDISNVMLLNLLIFFLTLNNIQYFQYQLMELKLYLYTRDSISHIQPFLLLVWAAIIVLCPVSFASNPILIRILYLTSLLSCLLTCFFLPPLLTLTHSLTYSLIGSPGQQCSANTNVLKNYLGILLKYKLWFNEPEARAVPQSLHFWQTPSSCPAHAAGLKSTLWVWGPEEQSTNSLG